MASGALPSKPSHIPTCLPADTLPEHAILSTCEADSYRRAKHERHHVLAVVQSALEFIESI